MEVPQRTKKAALNRMSANRTSDRAPVDVTIILVSYNTAHLLPRLFDTIRAGTGTLRVQVIAVDNRSTDGSAAFIAGHYPEVEIFENEANVGFGRANNQALEHARGRYILLLNTDAFVAADTIPLTVVYMDEHPDCGVLGVQLVGEDGRIQPSCRYFPTPWNTFLVATGLNRVLRKARLVDDPTWDPGLERDCDWVPGCYYLIRREVVENIGLFDPRYFMYLEEVDHCRAVKAAGWAVRYYPHTQVTHIGGESARFLGKIDGQSRQLSELQIESELLYYRKHSGGAGVAAALCLRVLGESIIAAKRIARGAPRDALQAYQQNLARFIRIARKTNFGVKATR